MGEEITREIVKYLETNESKNNMSLMDTMKAIPISSYI